MNRQKLFRYLFLILVPAWAGCQSSNNEVSKQPEDIRDGFTGVYTGALSGVKAGKPFNETATITLGKSGDRADGLSLSYQNQPFTAVLDHFNLTVLPFSIRLADSTYSVAGMGTANRTSLEFRLTGSSLSKQPITLKFNGSKK